MNTHGEETWWERHDGNDMMETTCFGIPQGHGANDMMGTTCWKRLGGDDMMGTTRWGRHDGNVMMAGHDGNDMRETT